MVKVALSVVCDVTKEADIENFANKTRELVEKNNFKLWGGEVDVSIALT
jgi:hypothetical protein